MASIAKYQAAHGVRWRVQYTDPMKKRRTKTGFKTKKAAEHWCAENIVERNTGSWIAPEKQRATIGKLGETWLSLQTHLKPSTMRRTEQTLANQVNPRWGSVKLSEITPHAIQEWVANMDSSPSTVRKAHACLAQILDLAVSQKMLQTNPARGIKLPRKEKPKAAYLTAEQLLQLVDCMPRFPELVLLLGTSGLRFSEAAALRVKDVDVDRKRIHVARAAVTVGGRVEIGSTKTHERRTVAVASHTLEALKIRLEGRSGDSLLWSRQDGEPLRIPHSHHWYYVGMNKAMEEHGLPRVTPHGLRHVAAGLLVSAGANVKVVQRQLGHASAAMTLDVYADLFDGDLDEVADVLDRQISSVVKNASNTPGEAA